MKKLMKDLMVERLKAFRHTPQKFLEASFYTIKPFQPFNPFNLFNLFNQIENIYYDKYG